MQQYVGTHPLRLDEKSRLFLPARWRESFAEGVVLTPGQDRCVYVFPQAEFARVTERLRAASINDAAARAYARVMLSGAFDQVPDKQGRVSVTPFLREYAQLDRDVALIGMDTRAEVWNAGAWQGYLTGKLDDFAQRSQEVLPGLI